MAVVLLWSAIRATGGSGKAVGFWDQAVASYGGVRLIQSTELGERAHAWARLGGYLFGWESLGVLFLIGIVLLMYRDFRQNRRTARVLADIALLTFALAYFLFHWLLAFPVWDRYMLPLVPVLGLLAGRMVATWSDTLASKGQLRTRFDRSVQVAAHLFVGIALLGSSLAATGGRIPAGADHGAYEGLTRVIAFLRTRPVGTVLYDRWLSWHYDFYLFDTPLYRAGFSSPEWLAADAAAFYDGRPRYVVVPQWESADRLKRNLADYGLALTPALTARRQDGSPSFIVYEIGSHG
jgi:hypothetical protein